MNYLQLCQRMVQKCGIAGSGPSSVLNQTGELARVVNWINEAWLSIQEERADWQWMRKSVSFTTVYQQRYYTPAQCGISDFARWAMDTKENSFRCYLTSVGTASEIFLSYLEFETFRDTYVYGAMRTTYSRPVVITVAPDKSIGLGLAPDNTGYTITGDYFSTPTQMTANTDTPEMPDRFHMLIVYRAMMYYADYEQDAFLRQTAEAEYNRMLRRLTTEQLPEFLVGASLA